MTSFRIGDIVSNGPGAGAIFTGKIRAVTCDGLFFIGKLGPYHSDVLRWPTPSEMALYRDKRLEEIASEREIAEYDRDYAEGVLEDLDEEQFRLEEMITSERQIAEYTQDYTECFGQSTD